MRKIGDFTGTSDANCAAGHYCNGVSCVLKQAIGATCTKASECSSGACVDGYCCNSACGSACDACNLTNSEGTCNVVPASTSGDPSCTPYLCDGIGVSCPVSCGSDAGCVSNHFCIGNSCTIKKVNGTVCNGANECLSGNCVDGYCCNGLCGSACDACNLANNLGSCKLKADGAKGKPSCTPYLCNGVLPGCPVSCLTNGDCVMGYTCNFGVCLGGSCSNNLVTDASFEAGSPNPNWTESSTNFTSPLCTIANCGSGSGTGPRTESWWGWFGGLGGGSHELAKLEQSVTITAGAAATLKFYFEAPACSLTGVDTFKIFIDNTLVYSTDNSDPSCGSLGYVLRSANVSAWADGQAHTLLLEGETFGGTGGALNTRITNFMVDDIEIVSCN